VKFCPRCGSLMVVRKVDDKLMFVCPNCGYTEEVKSGSSVQLAVLRKEIKHSEKEKIVVVDPNINWKAMPKTRVTCPRCGYHEAYVWVVQTRRADEPPTRFFKCVRCGYVWREYD